MSGRRSSSRFAARLAGGAIFLALLGVVFAETLYLLRLPLVEPLLRAVLQRQLGEVLGGAVQIGRIEGNWWSQVVVRDLRVEGAGPLRNVRDASLELRLDP